MHRIFLEIKYRISPIAAVDFDFDMTEKLQQSDYGFGAQFQ